MTTKQKATRILTVTGVAWLVWVAPMPAPFSRCTLEEVRSPSHVGSAIFYTSQGFQGGPSTVLFIRDYAKSGSKPLKLADEDNADFPLDAVWSKDGTLLAVGNGGEWDSAYDFSQHRQISRNSRSASQNSKFFKDLLSKHGGLGLGFEGRTRLQRWWEDFDVNASYLISTVDSNWRN